MRPIKLEITGLQSFSKKQVVDFDSLTSLGLFGIFGETGSGKSTILDAMIFAIFDEIPRTMGSKGKNIRPCLNQDSDILEVYFKFALGNDIFEITRTYKKKFSRKGEEKFEQSNPILIINKDVVADTVKNVESKIDEYFGMSVHDFTRSVVLPQGKFSEFLKLKGVDKMTMLENIFDLEKYGTKMSEKIKVRNNKLKDEITSLENQIKGKGDCSLEKINDIKENLILKENEYNTLIKNKAELEKEFNQLKELKGYFEKLDIYNDELQKLQLSEDKVNESKSLLEKHIAADSFKDLIDEIKNLKDSFIKNKGELTTSKTTLDTLNNALEVLKTKENELQMEIEKIMDELDNLKVDYNELDNLRKGDEYIRALHFKEKLLQESINSSNGLELDLDSLSKKLKENKENLKTESLNYENLEKMDTQQILQFENEVKELSNEISLIESKLKDKESLKKEIQNIDEKKVSTLCNIDNCKSKIEEISKKSLETKAFEISKSLVSGECCPVCGSKEHPNPAKDTESVDLNELEIYSKEKDQLEKALIEIDTKLNYCSDKLNELNNLKDVETLRKELSEKEISLNALKEKEKELLLKESDLKNKVSLLKNDISSISLAIDEKKLSLDKIKSKIASSEEDILKEKEKIASLNLERDSIEFIEERKTLLENMEREYREVLSRKESLNDSLRVVKDNIFKDLNEIQKINLAVVSLEEKNNHIKDSCNEKSERLKTEATTKGFNSTEEILSHIFSEEKVLELNTFIENFEKDYTKYSNLKDEILKNIDNRTFDLKRWDELNSNLEEISKEEQNLFKEVTEYKGELKRVEQLFKESKELLEKIEQLRLKQDDILILQKKFEGRKFVKFLARKRLDYIAYEASKRLQKITRGRYLLTVDNNCDFNIVDAFNSNFTRECSTLSGGETFIVSLVLALALSSQLQLKGKVQLEFFFLDEGFGTLDTSLLDRVIEILEEIRWKEKMKIGIISHVEDLKIRIPRRLEVSAAIPGETGSLIKLI